MDLMHILLFSVIRLFAQVLNKKAIYFFFPVQVVLRSIDRSMGSEYCHVFSFHFFGVSDARRSMWILYMYAYSIVILCVSIYLRA